jgi:hypothetical protein
MANRGIAQSTLGDVSYVGSGRVGGVGDCTRPMSTLGAPGETSGPRIDRFPSTRPPWRHRQFCELKKLFFLGPVSVVSISLAHQPTERYSNNFMSCLVLHASVLQPASYHPPSARALGVDATQGALINTPTARRQRLDTD